MTSPIACNLEALVPAQRERWKELTGALPTLVREVRELDDGYEARFEPSAWSEIAEFVSYERLCCPFLRFVLEAEEEGGPLRLRITGRQAFCRLVSRDQGPSLSRIFLRDEPCHRHVGSRWCDW